MEKFKFIITFGWMSKAFWIRLFLSIIALGYILVLYIAWKTEKVDIGFWIGQATFAGTLIGMIIQKDKK